MLVLHGAWLPLSGTDPGRFGLWAELSPGARRLPRRAPRSARARRAPPHPFAADAAQLAQALAELGLAEPAAEAERLELVARLPSAGGAPQPSPQAWAAGRGGADDAPLDLAAWTVPALALGAARAPAVLVALAGAAAAPQVQLGDDLCWWGVAGRFALELLYRQRLAPALLRANGRALACWRPLLDEAEDARRFQLLWQGLPPAGRALARDPAEAEPGARDLLLGFLEEATDALARRAAREAIEALFRAAQRRPGRQARASAADAWLRALVGDARVQAEASELAAFARQYQAWTEAAAGGPSHAEAFRVCFRLDPPPAAEAPGVHVPRPEAREWSLRYFLQAADEPSLLVPAAEVWRQRGATARFLNRRLDQPHERLLAGLGRAARLFPPIEASLRTATPEACLLTAGEAHAFLREAALLLKASGFGVLVPSLDSRLGLRVRLRGTTTPKGGAAAGLVGWDAVVQYDWQLALGGEPLSREEFETLARLKAPLVQVRGQWVELRPEQLEQALAALRRPEGGQLGLVDALTLALAPDGQLGLPVVEVAAEGWLNELLRQLRDGGERPRLQEPPGFVGALRGYQRVGLSWLASLRRFGLGACLADDMGLGKTPQLIALLLHQRAEAGEGDRQGPTLIVCPTSVVGNWHRELARFAPSLRTLVHHGAARAREDFAQQAAGHDVVISTYALLPRDEQALAGVEWANVVLDEAQNIKNPATRAARVARGLRAHWRAALTGTPVENRLEELWSIFQFLNPGFLGSAEAFRRRFAGPIERMRDAAAAERLKRLVGPFILRRVKTDRSIIADLPEKNEMKVYCSLTREQATLYEAVLKEALEQLEAAEGIRRRGLVLATLTRLKQVCNHPALLLHDRSALHGRSGKLARLAEMLEEVLAVDERALVFTQYAEMGRMLHDYLRDAFDREVLFLHGGTPARERDRMVARFQQDDRAPSVFVLSLKAGGTGLNLTRANHVFHFDRWWNPAVENQATDRAFRIGQRRDVQVHTFLCAGTFEEALDQLIERKVELAETIVGTSEAWITELSNAELRELFALRHEAAEVAWEEDGEAGAGGAGTSQPSRAERGTAGSRAR